jgi:hypothetical protein
MVTALALAAAIQIAVPASSILSPVRIADTQMMKF